MSKILVEYIWIDGTGGLRSKTKVISRLSTKQKFEIPEWNFDGSSTVQAEGHYSEVMLHPRRIFKDPFRRNSENYLAMCSTHYPDGKPSVNNNYEWAASIFAQKPEEQPLFGMEQEYFMLDPKTRKPLGFGNGDKIRDQGPYYCGVGANNVFGRQIAEEHLEHCIYAGINVTGCNNEVAISQNEYQICAEGIEAGDQLWMARYIMERVAEKHNVLIELHPKPFLENWNGSGCHVNYSTKLMREGLVEIIPNDDPDEPSTDPNSPFGNLNKKADKIIVKKKGIEYINEAIEKLEKKHEEHMKIYGEDNRLRMTGIHETATYDKFTWGIANRGASIRVGNETSKNEKGYLEDRRPGSNIDPYLVTAKIFETTCLQ